MITFYYPKFLAQDDRYLQIDEDDNYTLACTSQKEKKEAYIKNKGYELSTLVCISPDDNND